MYVYLYTENYKTLLRKINEEISHAHGPEDSKVLKCQFFKLISRFNTAPVKISARIL